MAVRTKTVCVEVADVFGGGGKVWYSKITEPSPEFLKNLALIDDPDNAEVLRDLAERTAG